MIQAGMQTSKTKVKQQFAVCTSANWARAKSKTSLLRKCEDLPVLLAHIPVPTGSTSQSKINLQTLYFREDKRKGK